jgi:hypothetical protein
MTKVLDRGLRSADSEISSMKTSRMAAALALAAALFYAAASEANAAEYGVNLIVNGNAEGGPFSLDGGPVANIPGWAVSGAPTVVKYGATGGFPTSSDPGPFDRANAFFAGGSTGSSVLNQDIDVSANAVDIDAGKVACDIVAWLGGFLNSDDDAIFLVQFRKDAITANGSAPQLGPVLATDRGGKTGLLARSETVPIPAGTRIIRVILVLTRNANNGGAYNDGYADSLSIVLRGPVVVTSAADSGQGSLRDALPKATAITFDPVVFGAANAPHVIELTSGLNVINSDLTITGPGADLLTVHMNRLDRSVFFVDGTSSLNPVVRITALTTRGGFFGINCQRGDLTLDHVILRDAVERTSGIGAISSTIHISNSLITGNTDGGAAFDTSSVFLASVTISSNTTSNSGAGLYNREGSLTATNCTISGNANNSGSPVTPSIIYGSTSSFMTLVNCTVSYNSLAFFGYTFYTENLSLLQLSSCTIAGNTVSRSILAKDNTTIKLANSIISDAGGSFLTEGTGNSIVSQGYNISGDDGGGFLTANGDRALTTSASLKLGPLQDNGGPTFTRALLAGSIAIDKGNSSLTTDQRGAPRPVVDPNSASGGGNNSDIGAFEFQGTPPVVLANISGRLPVGTGDNALFAGFIVSGYQPKRVIIRAIGPSLGVAGRLADPTLDLFDSEGVLVQTNDNWKDSPDKQAIIDSTVAPTNDLESAIVATLPASVPGSRYTAVVRGTGNATGIGVVEVYDLDRTVDSKLANISNRGFVQTGDNALFAGNIVVGQSSQKVIIRAIGPSLLIRGGTVMADPTLELHDANGGLLESNDNWVDSPNKQAIIDSTIPPSNNLESAIVRTLPPANYTAIVRGANNTTGIAVVEVYALN